MEIQSISGFHLAATTVTPADGRPPSRPNRHRCAFLPNRSPAETRTIDFRHGLETYIPPRVFKRPNTSQVQRKPGSKKDHCNESKESSVDIEEREKELEAMANADIKEIVPQGQTSIAKDDEVSVALECQDKISTPSSTESTIPDPSMVCTCCGSSVVGLESKRHGDYASSQESKAWFQKTLQEYEDLKKSVEAHISSAPSERNELGADANPGCVKIFREEIPLQDKAFSDIHGREADEAHRKYGYTAKMSRVGSPALSTYSCGCAAKSFPTRTLPNLDMDAVQDAAWKKMVETVAQLRETNRALQQTVKELQERQYKPYDVGALAERKEDSLQSSGVSLYEPGLRKRVLGTLKSSVHRMEGLMFALRDEQEKSRNLSAQLQGFLRASKDMTPHRTPRSSVSRSRSTSPVERCTRFDYLHRPQTLSAISPACAVSEPEHVRAGSPEKATSPVCRCDHGYLHQRQTSPTGGNISRSSSPTPVLCTIKMDTPKQNSPKVSYLSENDVQMLSLSDHE